MGPCVPVQSPHTQGGGISYLTTYPACQPVPSSLQLTVGRGVPVLSKTYYRAARYVEIVRTPTERMQSTLYLSMRNEYGQVPPHPTYRVWPLSTAVTDGFTRTG